MSATLPRLAAVPIFDTLDDLMRVVLNTLLQDGVPIRPTKGPAKELTGVLLGIANPRARLSRTETRGKLFSCLGELCWYLAGSADLDFIRYYIPKYNAFANGQQIFGAYGPRLVNRDGLNQIANVTQRLRDKPHSRRAVIQLFDADDVVADHKDIPCTCTLQFLRRNQVLHMFTYMRSNDAYIGLPHDVFFFTILQEIIARDLSIDIGTYKHAVGSLHLYDTDQDAAQQFLSEGWQSTEASMPAMPQGNPWPAIRALLSVEVTLRAGHPVDLAELDQLGTYWSDLARLLEFLRAYKCRDLGRAIEICGAMKSPVYSLFLDEKLRALGDLTDVA